MPDARISELPAATLPTDADLLPLVQANETRRGTVAQLRRAVLADRTAHGRDYGVLADGVADDAPAIQAAVNDLATRGGGILELAPRVHRIASPIVISGATVRLSGQGFTEGPGPGQGTWLLIDGTGFAPITFTGTLARGAGLEDLALVQTHAAAQDANWAPTNYPFAIRIEDCLGGVDIHNVFLCNLNRGIFCRNSGRLDINRLRGQVLRIGVEIDDCLDVPRIDNLHFWPFWSGNVNVIRWTQANGDALLLKRTDGIFVDHAFVLGYRSMFRFAAGANGVTTKFYIGQAYADFVRYAVWIDSAGVNGQISGLTTQHEGWATSAPIPGSAGLFFANSGARVQVANLRIDAVEDSAIRVDQANNRLDLFSLRCNRFNSRSNGAPAILLADSGANPPNACYLGSPPQLDNGNGGPLTNAGSNATLALGAPGGRAARPGLSVGGDTTGFFAPSGTALAAAIGGAEVLRATLPGTVTLGGAPGSHALEVTAPVGATNRVVANGAVAGGAVGLVAGGADANIGLTLSAKGTGALSAGVPDNTAAGGNARGSNAVDWQAVRSTATQVAAGTNATIGGGSANTAAGLGGTVAGGSTNSAGGTNAAIAGGQNNVADASNSWVPGGLRASVRGGFGRGVWASGQFAAIGDAQAGEAVLRRQTADATPARLTADSNAPNAGNSLTLPNGATLAVRVMVIARHSATGDSAAWDVTALLRRGANAAATVLVGGGGATLTPTHADAGGAGWRLALGADATLGALALSGTGEAGKTLNWVARVLSVETFG